MPEPPYWTAQKFLVEPHSPLTVSGTVGKSAGDRRGGWPGCSISTRCTWFSRRPRRGWSWIDYSRLAGARSARARPPHASPRSPRPHSHTRARASASLSRSTRALLTALVQGRKAPPTPTSTPQPRAPPADLAGDVAGGSSEVSSQPSHGGRPMVGCLGGLFESPPRIASDPGRTGATSSRCLATLAAILATALAAALAAAARREVDGAACGAALGGREGRAAAARVRRWRGARPYTRRRSAPGPRAPRPPSRARVGGCARALYVYSFSERAMCGRRAVVGRIDVLRRPHDRRASFAFGCVI